MKIGALPHWADKLGNNLCKDGYFKSPPDQVIVNEYEPGQGIAPHIDCEPCFEDTIISLSLGSDAVMEFQHSKTKGKIPLLLKRRSLVILKSESRYNWLHSIPARKTDTIDNHKIQRENRISLTFRKVIL